MADVEIRNARPEDASVLRRICLESKRSWGYADDFMARFAKEVVIATQSMEVDQVFVASVDAEIVGWARVLTDRKPMILDDLWVKPTAFGKGVGRLLFAQAVVVVRRIGGEEFELDADPNAQGFYEHMGCVRIGETFTSMGRYIPRMRYVLAHE